MQTVPHSPLTSNTSVALEAGLWIPNALAAAGREELA
jgi:hypothetical protein